MSGASAKTNTTTGSLGDCGRARGLDTAARDADACDVLHEVPGRLRARIRGLRDCPSAARAIERRTQAVPGVRRARANHLTGNVLVEYDPSAAAPRQIIAALSTMRDGWQGYGGGSSPARCAVAPAALPPRAPPRSPAPRGGVGGTGSWMRRPAIAFLGFELAEHLIVPFLISLII